MHSSPTTCFLAHSNAYVMQQGMKQLFVCVHLPTGNSKSALGQPAKQKPIAETGQGVPLQAQRQRLPEGVGLGLQHLQPGLRNRYFTLAGLRRGWVAAVRADPRVTAEHCMLALQLVLAPWALILLCVEGYMRWRL